MSAETYYQLLGVRDDAAPEVIRAAYRSLIRKYHPDVAGAAGAARTALLNDAYGELGDPARRLAYDRKLAAASSGTAPGTSAPSSDATYRRSAPEPSADGSTPPPRPREAAAHAEEEFSPDYRESTFEPADLGGKPWSAGRLRFWMSTWLIGSVILLAGMWFLCWTSFWAPVPPAIFRGLPAAFIAPVFAVAFLHDYWRWLWGVVAAGVLLGPAAAPAGSPLHFLTADISGESFAVLAALGVFAVVVRVARPRAKELFGMRPQRGS